MDNNFIEFHLHLSFDRLPGFLSQNNVQHSRFILFESLSDFKIMKLCETKIMTLFCVPSEYMANLTDLKVS